VEILSALEERVPNIPHISPDLMGKMKTLGQILDHLSETVQNHTIQKKTSL
jgi:hypothetical protein